MKYSLDDAVNIVCKKRDKLILNRKRKSLAFLSVITVITAILLIAAIREFAGIEAAENMHLNYGAFLLPYEAGGYILTGVICFTLAVILTLLCLHIRGKHDTENRELKKDNNTGQEIESTEKGENKI